MHGFRTMLAIAAAAVCAALGGAPAAGAQDLPVLERGDRGVAVEYWQGELNQWLDYARDGRRILGEDGVFGPRTEAATRDFQDASGLTVDGIVGESTWTQLYRTLGERAETLIARANVVPEWPVPVPRWFWPWARWYLGHGEFQGQARDGTVRPAAAPARIPNWAWRRMNVMNGRSVQARAVEFVFDRVDAIWEGELRRPPHVEWSQIDGDWILVTGSILGEDSGAVAAWLRHTGNRWQPWNLGRLPTVETAPSLVPCDLKRAFSEPQC